MWLRLSSCALSILLALGVTALVWVYLDAAHAPGNVALALALSAVAAVSAFAAWKWLNGAGVLGAAWSRASLALRVVTVAIVALVALDLFGWIGPGEEDFDGGPSCAECWLVTVERVVDGDTLVTDVGRVRLYGVDAPELGEPCGDEATDRLRRLAGGEIRLEDGPRIYDRFERRLAYVYTEDGRSIDAALVWGGYAVAWTSDGQHREELAGLERDARSEGRGCLW